MDRAAEHRVRLYKNFYDVTFVPRYPKRTAETVAEIQNGSRAKEKALLTTIWLFSTHIGFPNEIIERIVHEILQSCNYLIWNAAWYRHEQQLVTAIRRNTKPVLKEYQKAKTKFVRKKW